MFYYKHLGGLLFMKKMRYAKGNTSTLKAVLLGAVIIWVSFFTLTLISALILYSGNDPAL